MTEFQLPTIVRELVDARNKLRAHYSDGGLKFTLDGNLVGNLGEAIAVELFSIRLSNGDMEGFDGIASDGRTVQVKAPTFACGGEIKKVR